MTILQNRIRTKLLIPALLLAFGAALAHAQRPQGGPAGDLLIDFIAVDATGQPVAGLQPGDVSIKIAGKARTITALELKRFDGGGAPAAAATAAPSAAPPPFATNSGAVAAAPSAGRTMLIIIDQDSLRAGSERAIVASLEPVLKTLTPADRVAFHTTPRDTAQALGIANVRAALGKFTGQKAANSGGNDNICRSSDTLVQLRGMMEGLPPSDKPATVLFFGSGLSNPAKTSSGTTCEVTTDHFRALASSVAIARVNMFVIQGDEGVTGRDDGLENLAGQTAAGAVLRVTGPALARVTTESTAYYLATVKAESDDRPNQMQRLELKVNKEGVATRARTDISIGRSMAAAAGPAAAGAKPGAAASAADMLRNANASYTDLKLNATTIVARGPAGKVALLTLVEPADPSVKLKELTAGVVDLSAGKIAPFKADEKQLAARPIPMPMSSDVGKIKVRVVALDESGKGGAVDVDVSTDLTTAGPVKVGGILLVAPRPGGSYAPQLTFSTEPEIGVSFEIYGDVSKGLGAKVELAATPDGPALETVQPGGSQTSEPDKFVLNAKIPIAKLAPGDYVVRAIVQVPDQPEGRVYRTLRKVGK